MTTTELTQFLEHVRTELAEDGMAVAPAMLDAAIARLKEQDRSIFELRALVETRREAQRLRTKESMMANFGTP
jgi:hypothetical protein